MNTFEIELKKYFREMKKLLPIYGNVEKRLLLDLKQSMMDYIGNNSNCTWKAVIEHFGLPREAAYNYISSLDQLDLCERVALRENRIAVVAVVATVIAIAAIDGRMHFN